MIEIRKGKIEDFDQLEDEHWAWSNSPEVLEERKKWIKQNKVEFYVVVDEERIIGEFHIFWEDLDKDIDFDHAKKGVRAHLSTFRMHPDYRGQGLGRKLKDKLLEVVLDAGYTEVTIGAYAEEKFTQDMYQRWGFEKQIKRSIEKLPGFPDREYILYLKKL